MIHLQSVPGLPPSRQAGSAPGNGAMPKGPGYGAAFFCPNRASLGRLQRCLGANFPPSINRSCSLLRQQTPDF